MVEEECFDCYVAQGGDVATDPADVGVIPSVVRPRTSVDGVILDAEVQTDVHESKEDED